MIYESQAKRNNNMSLDEVIKDIKQICQRPYSKYYCGVTNNTQRRKMEHHINDFIVTYECKDRNAVMNLLISLKSDGFQCIDNRQNGQDDSLTVYIYEITNYSKEELENSFDLSFSKTWYEADSNLIPEKIGIYACFACDEKLVNNTYQNSKVIYIGMTKEQDFKTRIQQHKNNDFKKWENDKHFDPRKQQLVFAIAECNLDVLQSIESALIYANKPCANDDEKKIYHGEYNEISVHSSGAKGNIRAISEAKYMV